MQGLSACHFEMHLQVKYFHFNYRVNISLTLPGIQCSFGWRDDSEAGAKPALHLLFSTNFLLLCDTLKRKQLLLISHRENQTVHKTITDLPQFYSSMLDETAFPYDLFKDTKEKHNAFEFKTFEIQPLVPM